MSIFVNNIILSLDDNEDLVYDIALKSLKLDHSNIKDIRIRKKSIDARREKIRLVYSVCVNLKDPEFEPKLVKELNKPNIVWRGEGKKEEEINTDELTLIKRPVIVGFGPAGIFSALKLAKAGLRPIVLERGKDIDKRAADVESFWKGGCLNTESNVQFGEGGAGAFSDGKLNTGINDENVEYVLKTFYEHGAKENILINTRPHVGTDILRKVVKSIRQEIINLGGEIRFYAKVSDIIIKNSKVTGVKLSDGEVIETDVLILALGHSARDTIEMLYNRGFMIIQKPFSAGVRLERPQKDIDRAIYGKYAGHPKLPPAEFKLSYREGTRGVYTFCMCPGGVVVPASSEEGGVAVNGMSYSDRAGENANAAVVVSVLPEDFESSHPLAGFEFQRNLERLAFEAGGRNYYAPVQCARDFIDGSISKSFKDVLPTYSIGTRFCDLNNILPTFICEMIKKGLNNFDKKLDRFNSKKGLLTGVETRTSSPVRICRDENMMAIGIMGVYPVGEGAGYAGGIVSAAVDGIKASNEIIKKFKI